MNVMEGFTSYQVVVFTTRHTLTGDLTLKDKRLSDHINERVDSNLNLRNVSVARLDDPARPLYHVPIAVLPKPGIVLIFEPPQKAIPPSKRFFGYTEKIKNDVFLIMDGMEVRGTLHTQGPLDFRILIADVGNAFLPITQATVVLESNRNLVVKQEAILVNTQRIRFFGQFQPNSATQPRKTQPPPPI